MNISQHSLLQEASTRWNSTYLMYEQLAEQWWAIYAVIHNIRVTPSDKRYLYLTADQWDLLLQLLVVLKPLQVATTALSCEQNVSSSLVYPIIHGLIKCHLKPDTNDLPAIKRFKETVISQVKERFAFDPENIAILSAAVDPRYHGLEFLRSEQHEEVTRVLLERIGRMEKECQQAEKATGEGTEEPRRKRIMRNSFVIFIRSHFNTSLQKNISQNLSFLKRSHKYIMMKMHWYCGKVMKWGFQ